MQVTLVLDYLGQLKGDPKHCCKVRAGDMTKSPFALSKETLRNCLGIAKIHTL